MAHRNPDFVEITCADEAKFREMPDHELQRVSELLAEGADRVARRAMTKQAHSDLESGLGFKHNPFGVVGRAELRNIANPIRIATWDWVHSMLQGGTLVTEIEAMIAATAIQRAEVQAFLADPLWCFPSCSKTKSKMLHRIFDSRRVSADEQHKVKGSCAEFLGLYGMLRCFVVLTLADRPEVERHVQSFNACCDIVDAILALKRGLVGITDGAARLAAACRRHLSLHIDVYGTAFVKPKHHWVMDLSSQYLRDGIVLDAFVVERTHLQIKSVAEHVKNTRAFERSVLSGVMVKAAQETDDVTAGLVGRTAVLPGGHMTVRVADRMRVYDIVIGVGDVVTRDGSAGRVAACARQQDDLFVLVHRFVVVTPLGGNCNISRQEDAISVWRAADVVHAVAWLPRSNGEVLIVLR